MSGESFDAQGEAHEALGTAVNSYGARVLSDPRILGNLVGDLLPDLPRERSLLVTAAEAGVAGELTQHVEGQRLDADTAVALVARSLTETRSLDPAASLWVSTEYAQALGYQVRSQVPPAGAAVRNGTPPSPPPTPTETALPWQSPPQSPPVPPVPTPKPPVSQPPVSQPSFAPSSQPETRFDLKPVPRFTPTQQPAAASPPVSPPPVSPPQPPPARTPPQDPWQSPIPAPPQDPWSQDTLAPTPSPWQRNTPTPPQEQPPPARPQDPWQSPIPAPPQNQPPNQWPPASGGGPVNGGGANSRRGLFLGGGAAAAIIVLYVIIAAVAHAFPFSASPKPTPTPPVPSVSPSVHTTASSPPPSTPPPSPTPTPTASASLAPGVMTLKVLLPTDIQSAATECATQTGIPWKMPGLVKGLECNAPDMANGQIFGYQLDSVADYNTAWHNYNSWATFGVSKSLDCPPPSGDSQGGPGDWWNNDFPQRAGQVLECFSSNSGPVYVWTYPTEDTFIVAQPPKSWSYSQLNTWWVNNAA
jgi:hypothetical protein